LNENRRIYHRGPTEGDREAIPRTIDLGHKPCFFIRDTAIYENHYLLWFALF